MRRTLTILLTLSVLGTGIAFAGERNEECTADTQTYLSKLVTKIKQKPWLGADLEKTEHGYYRVTSVVADSPAEAAGFQPGDYLVALNGVKLSADNKKAIKAAKKALGPGKTATYTVKRSSGKQQLAVTFGHVPDTVMAELIGNHILEQHTEVVLAAK